MTLGDAFASHSQKELRRFMLRHGRGATQTPAHKLFIPLE
jgi:hypothetical protein